MILQLGHSLQEASAVLRGELGEQPNSTAFSIDGLRLWRVHGFRPGLGSASIDLKTAWEAVIRGWWGLGATWGIFVRGRGGAIEWNVLLPDAFPTASNSLAAHLGGANTERGESFDSAGGILSQFRFRAVIAGHPGSGEVAPLHSIFTGLQKREFVLVVLAGPSSRRELNEQIERLGNEEQYVRDEYLARPSLERDSHSAATQYLGLVESARDRATRALQEGGWQVRTLFSASGQSDFEYGRTLLHAAYTAGESAGPEPVRWQDVSARPGLTFLRTAEAAIITRPPENELAGFEHEVFSSRHPDTARSCTDAIFSTTASRDENMPTVALGRIIGDDGAPAPWLEIPTADLCRHTLVAGMTGSGKTTTCEHLLLEVWRDHHIPWLVLEPGMNPSYRRLVNSEIGNDLRIYSVGGPETHRLPLNPLAAAPGLPLAEHIGGLFAVLTSAFELVPPMPEILSLAIDETYRSHGWNTAGLVPVGRPPNLLDLITTIGRVVAASGYSAEIRGNIHAGLVLRMRRLLDGPLGPELARTDALDLKQMLATPCVIELAALPNGDSQALVLGLIALQLRHYWRMSEPTDALRHLTLIEEAHRLLRQVADTAANASRVRAVEDIANMLAELRAKGAGLIIADQTPSALVASVVANTGTKILHRLDHPADRELAGRAAGLPVSCVDLLGALRPGDSIVRTDRRSKPFRLRIPNPSLTYAGSSAKPQAAPENILKQESDPAAICLVCGQATCAAHTNGSDLKYLVPRLRALHGVIPNGLEAVWQWAERQLGASVTTATAPLCFLMAVANAAELPRSAVDNLRQFFAQKRQPA